MYEKDWLTGINYTSHGLKFVPLVLFGSGWLTVIGNQPSRLVSIQHKGLVTVISWLYGVSLVSYSVNSGYIAPSAYIRQAHLKLG